MNEPVDVLLVQPSAGVLFGRCAMGATATLNGQVTLDEIRGSLEDRAENADIGSHCDTQDGLYANLKAMIVAVSYPLSESAAQTLEGGRGMWEPMREPAPDVLWGNLRPIEAAVLVKLVDEAADRARDRCSDIILEELTAAGVAFLAEYPDAPRP